MVVVAAPIINPLRVFGNATSGCLSVTPIKKSDQCA